MPRRARAAPSGPCETFYEGLTPTCLLSLQLASRLQLILLFHKGVGMWRIWWRAGLALRAPPPWLLVEALAHVFCARAAHGLGPGHLA